MAKFYTYKVTTSWGLISRKFSRLMIFFKFFLMQDTEYFLLIFCRDDSFKYRKSCPGSKDAGLLSYESTCGTHSQFAGQPKTWVYSKKPGSAKVNKIINEKFLKTLGILESKSTGKFLIIYFKYNIEDLIICFTTSFSQLIKVYSKSLFHWLSFSNLFSSYHFCTSINVNVN